MSSSVEGQSLGPVLSRWRSLATSSPKSVHTSRVGDMQGEAGEAPRRGQPCSWTLSSEFCGSATLCSQCHMLDVRTFMKIRKGALSRACLGGCSLWG